MPPLPELTVIWWRDIPAQVTAKAGRRRAAVQLSERFQEAIDAAAMRAGLIGTDAYLEEWRREPRACGEDLDAEVVQEAEWLEAAYTDDILERLVRASGEGDRMSETVLSSASREVVIGFERPFVIIGERINPTGRKQLAAEMAAGNFETVVADTIAQVEAGAQMLDVNAGIPLADEPAILAQTIRLVQSITDVPLSIDSSIVAALEAGLDVYQGKALVNSVTGEDERMERCCRSWPGTALPSSPSRTTRPGSPRTPTCASRSPARSSPAPLTTGSRGRTSSSTRS